MYISNSIYNGAGSDVYEDVNCASDHLAHSMLLIGYTPDYWHIKARLVTLVTTLPWLPHYHVTNYHGYHITMLPWLPCYHVTRVTTLPCYHGYHGYHITMVTMLPWLPHYHGYHVTMVTTLPWLPWLPWLPHNHGYLGYHVTMVTTLPCFPCYHDNRGSRLWYSDLPFIPPNSFSYGTSFGDNGYLKLKRGSTAVQCEILKNVWAVNVTPRKGTVYPLIERDDAFLSFLELYLVK